MLKGEHQGPMLIPFEKKVLVSADVLMEELDAESVFLNLRLGIYLGLNESGTCMWKSLTNSPSIQSAFERLLAEYDVEADCLRKDIQALVEKLLEHGLVEIE